MANSSSYTLDRYAGNHFSHAMGLGDARLLLRRTIRAAQLLGTCFRDPFGLDDYSTAARLSCRRQRRARLCVIGGGLRIIWNASADEVDDRIPNRAAQQTPRIRDRGKLVYWSAHGLRQESRLRMRIVSCSGHPSMVDRGRIRSGKTGDDGGFTLWTCLNAIFRWIRSEQ